MMAIFLWTFTPFGDTWALGPWRVIPIHLDHPRGSVNCLPCVCPLISGCEIRLISPMVGLRSVAV